MITNDSHAGFGSGRRRVGERKKRVPRLMDLDDLKPTGQVFICKGKCPYTSENPCKGHPILEDKKP